MVEVLSVGSAIVFLLPAFATGGIKRVRFIRNSIY